MTNNTHSICKLLLLFTGIMFSACENKPGLKTSYFNIDSVVNAQVLYLKGANAKLTKQAILNNKKDSTTASTKDSVGWANELGTFRQLDMINKPINKGLYLVKDTNDTKSNLRVRTFSATKEMPVESLKIYYRDSYANVRRIEGLYMEKNYLYSSSFNLVMEFDNLYNKTTLTNYSIKGDQKMFLGDTVHFAINGKVKIN